MLVAQWGTGKDAEAHVEFKILQYLGIGLCFCPMASVAVVAWETHGGDHVGH